jgi:hypothetical protein
MQMGFVALEQQRWRQLGMRQAEVAPSPDISLKN